MFQLIQKKKTKGNTRIWKNDTFRQYWEEALSCLNRETKSGFYNGAIVTAKVLMQDRKKLTESVPVFYKRLIGVYESLDIANTVKEKCEKMHLNMEHEIIKL